VSRSDPITGGHPNGRNRRFPATQPSRREMALSAPHPTFEVAQTSDRLGWGADIRVRNPPRPSNHCTMFPILNRYGSFPFKAHSAACAETRGDLSHNGESFHIRTMFKLRRISQENTIQGIHHFSQPYRIDRSCLLTELPKHFYK
jgi:hypothetical protein